MIATFDFNDKKLNRQNQYENILSTYINLEFDDDLSSEKSLDIKYFNNTRLNSSLNLLPNADTLINWYKTSEYYKRYNDFIRLQKSWGIDINSYNNIECHLYYGNSEKYHLLHQLIKYSENLSQNYNSDDELIFISLVEQFYLNITQVDIIILNASGIKKGRELSLLYIYRKIIYHKLLQLIKSKLQHLKIDLKRFFRNIIQFLFKNMDDEAHANNLFNHNSKEKRLLTYLNTNKWIIKPGFIISGIYSKIIF